MKLKTFKLYQQRSPIERDGEYVANIVHVKTIEAPGMTDAMIEAKKMIVFRAGRGLARWPMIEPENPPPKESYFPEMYDDYQ